MSDEFEDCVDWCLREHEDWSYEECEELCAEEVG